VAGDASGRSREEQVVVEPDNALPKVSLADLSAAVREAAARASWPELMPVQAKTIPYVLAKRDLMIQSRTGSGKTGAFVLPILERVSAEKNACQALILAPTRELAVQVADQAAVLAGDSGVRSVAVYGGVGYGHQVQAFKQGAHIVVGTPGRILDHLLNRNLSLQDLEILVFDEADRMLSIGFYPDMKQLQRYLPERRINGYMFSATFPPRVQSLAGEFLHDPQFLSLSRDHVHVAEVEHVYYTVPDMEKDRCLIRVIEIENPDSALIFCNTRTRVGYITAVLQRFGYDADQLTSDLGQPAREKVLGRVREGKLRFLVATDVAARGIDLPDLSHVIQYEPPDETEMYIHRAGRTGRAGGTGEAISLVTMLERLLLRRIGTEYRMDLQERPLPSDEDVAKTVRERVTALLEARLRTRDEEQDARMQQLLPMARSLVADEEHAPLVALLLDEHFEKTVGTSLGGEWDLDEEAILRLRQKLADHLRDRDKLQTERMQRVELLASSLAKSEEDIPPVAMLLDDFYQREAYGEVVFVPRPAPRHEERRRHPGGSDFGHRGPRPGGRPGGGRPGGGRPGGGRRSPGGGGRRR